jgi:hypothetical protein
MTRINALRNPAFWGSLGALLFAAVLIVCSMTVGRSGDEPKPVSSNNQISSTQVPIPVATPVPAPVAQAEIKPAPRKVVHRKPATVSYTDKTYGVAFEYPRRYAIETGDAARNLLASTPLPMNFVQPGGVALAAVELPETGFANTDFSSAFFNVSVNKSLTADQCNQFAVPQPKVMTATVAKSEPEAATPVAVKEAASAPATPAPSAPAAASEAQPAASPEQLSGAKLSNGSSQPGSATAAASSEQPSRATASNESAAASSTEPAPGSKLLLGNLELRATEAVSGEGTRQSDSKYFHVFQNGTCYEFALNVTTAASADGLTKHVDRDKLFGRLEKILDTVKITPVTPEVTAEAPAAPAAAETPAQ